HTDCPLTDFGGKTSIFSHPVYLFLRKFSLQDSRGGSVCRFYQQFVAFADNLLAKIFAALLILPHYLKCGFTFCN
ncbi:hypothetical protein QU795_13195, partial [Escherichia coli]|nr:hypothetical protein [Escherichia coli]